MLLLGAWLVTFVILVTTAVIDARTGRVPDRLLALGAVVMTAAWFLAQSWQGVWEHAWPALVLGGFLWLVNELWYRLRGNDAYGLGDVKWTMLVAFATHPYFAIALWPLAAFPALLWLGWRKLRGQPAGHVHFVPFLCAALVIAGALGLVDNVVYG